MIEYLENDITYVPRAFGAPERQLTPRLEPLSEVTSAEILRTGIDKPMERWSPRDESRVVGVLINLGFERKRRRVAGAPKEKRVAVYVRKEDSE